MQKSFKKAIASFLVVLMLLTSVPLNGFVGMDWSIFTASAAEENIISSLEDMISEKNEGNFLDFTNKFKEDKTDFSEFTEQVKDEAENAFSLMADKKVEQIQPVAKFSLRRSVAVASEETDFSWEYDEETRTLTVSGTGDMPDYTEMMEQEGVPTPIAPWAEYAREIEKVVIEAGITSVGDCAFALCTNLKQVVLPEGITDIGAGAFAYCVNLTNISLPSTLVSVGMVAFGMCWSVKEIVLPDSIETIGDMAFMYMFDLEKINLPASLQDNGEGMFTYALSLKELVVPEGLKFEVVYDVAEFFALSLEHITNYSATFAVDMSFEYFLGGYFDSLEYAEAFSYLYKNYFKYEFSSEEAAMLGIEVSEQQLIEDTINYFNTNLGTNYAVVDFESFEYVLAVSEEIVLTNLIQAEGYPSYFSVTCLEDSKQHELCRENAITHTIIDEDENCVCFAMSGTIGDNITWSVDGETKTLIFDGTGEMEAFDDVPGYVKYSAYIETISFSENSAVTSIGDYAFYGLSNVSEITLPEGIETLGEACFYNSGLKILNLPASLTNYDTLAFYMGTAPLEEINVADGNDIFLSYEGSLYSKYVEYEGEMTYLLLKQPEKYADTFIDNTIGIYYCAFEHYSTVKEISIPDTVLMVSEAAFLACSSMETINIGNSKIYEADGETASLEIDEDFVAYCNNLTAINVDERNVNYTSVDGVLYNKAVSELITVPNGKAEVVVPETVTNMHRYALDYDKLQKVTFLNPSCEIREESSAINRNATICGYKDSTAEAYADAFSRNFEYIGDITITGVDFDFTDAKKEYSQFDGLDTSGIKVTIHFSDGTSSVKDRGFKITGFDSNEIGTKVLTVTYKTYSDTYSITVKESFFPAQGGYMYFYINPSEIVFVGFTPEETKSLALNMSGYDGNTEYYVTVYEEDKQTVIYTGVLDYSNPVPVYTYEAGKTYYFAFSHNRTDYSHYLSVELIQSHDYYVSSSEEATCTESGYITYTCRTCGDSYTEYIYELGHNMVETVVSSATCTSDGEGIAECSRCDYSYSFSYTRLVHKDENTDDICDACSEEIISISVGETKNIQVSQGEYVYIKFIPAVSGRYKFYSNSSDDTYGYLYDANMNRLYSNDDDGEELNFSITYEFEAGETYWWGVRYYDSDYSSGSFDVTLECGHSGEWETVTEPTCTSVGSKTCVCVQCGKTVSEEIPRIAHNYELTETIPATCTEYGYERYDCTGCDDYYTDDIYSLGHDYIYITTKEATCTETGVESVTCSRCDYSDENTIAKTMHTDDSNDAVCDVCGAEILHISIDETKNITVNESETVYIKFVPAESGRYCFRSDAYDDTYGYLYDSNMNLLHSNDDDGETYNFLITYDFEAGKVYYFGVRYYSSSNSGSFDVTLECAHDGEWEVITQATCATVGLESCICNLCGKTVTKEIPKLSHSYELTETVSATCTEDGYERYDCTGCDEYYTNTFYASGHDYIYTVTKESTCSEEGKQTVTCSECDYNEESEIAKTRCTDTDNDYICDVCGTEVPHIFVGETQNVEVAEGETVYIKYIPSVSGTYKFYSTASTDTYGYLYDADMNHITYNDDGGEGSNFLIAYDFEAGKVYYFGVRYYSSSNSGSFDITLECAHNGEWEIITEATCETAGSKTCICMQCGETVTVEIPKLDHEYERTDIPETCREDRKYVYDCINCDYSYESFYDDTATGMHIDENSDNVCDMCSASFVCGDNLVWSLDENGTLTISGSGEMYDYTYPYSYPAVVAPWFADSSFINRIVISEDVTTIGDYAFFGLWKVTDIEWSNKIISIGEGAFRSCSGLSDITIPDSVIDVKAQSFIYCNGLTSVTIPNSVETIGYETFYDCYSLENIIFNGFDCEIYDSEYTIYSSAVIYGHENSTAKAYAEKYGRSFVATPCEAVYVEEKNATCIEKGNIEHYYCSVCGLYYSDENCTARINAADVFVDELGHNIGEITEEILPNCTESGYTKGTCSVCGEEFENSVAALGHSYSGEWEIAQELTCVTDGIKVKTCTVCGEKSGLVGITAEDFPKCIGTDYTHYMDTTFDSYSVPNASRIVLHFSADSYLESGYDYIYVYAGDSAVEENLVGRYTGSLAETVVNINASSFTIRMTTDGSVSKYGFEISSIDYYSSDNVEITPAPGHDYGEWETVTEATCTTSGSKERTCVACNDKETETISSFGHSYGEWVTKSEATCENNGIQEKICGTCGNILTNSLSALGHDYSLVDTIDATCTENGADKYICERCQNEYTKTFSPRHRDSDDDGFCDFCNEPYVGVLDLVFVIDSTGSMGDEVSVVKNSIQNYANQLAESNIPYYISLIDFSNDGSNNGKYNYYHINFDFTNDNSEISSGISGLSLKGGSDEPAYSALINGLDELHWGDDSVKRVILIGDETPWNEPSSTTGFDYDDALSSLTEREVVLYSVATGGTDIGIFESLATATNGSYYRSSTSSDFSQVLTDIIDSIPESLHIHTYEESYTDATCTRGGITTYHCTGCGKDISTETEPLGHNFSEEWTVDTEPTCTENGSKSHHCSRCDEKSDITGIEATGHNYESVVTEPTCTEKGYTTHTCSVCGSGYTDSIVNELGHSYSDWNETKAPTCTETGLEERVCSRCSDVDEQIMDALGHDHSEEWTVDKEATCTEDGSKSHHCTRCDDKADVTVIEKLGHAYSDWAVTTEPTCTKTGVEKRTCSRCGNVESQTVEALGHDYSEEWTIDKEVTCTEDGSKSHHCTRCDDKADVTVIEKLGHAYSDWAVTTEPTCTKTGVEKRTCSRCGNVESQTVEALGHDYSEEWTIDKEATCTEEGSKSHHCSRCDDKTDITVIEAHGHDYESVITEPTCTEAGYTTHTCSICEDTYTDTVVNALGHDYSEWMVTAEPTCTKTGVEKRTCSRCDKIETQTVEALGHDYSEEWTVDKEATCTEDGSKSHHCSGCSSKADVTVIPKGEHSYKAFEVVYPTCTTQGYTKYKCSICKAVKNDDYEDAVGHSFGEWFKVNDPDCVNKGKSGHTCSVCNITEYSYADSLGHNWSDWTVSVEPTVLADGKETRSCSRCNKVETKTLSRIEVDITENENYGRAHFTIVDAQTLEPIEGASIFISTENDGENTFFTDAEGKVSIVLPVGKQTIQAYAEGCHVRSLKVTINPGEQTLPDIGLSGDELVDAEITVEEMTLEEILEAGIDVNAEDNKQYYKWSLTCKFDAVPEFIFEYVTDSEGNTYYTDNTDKKGPGYSIVITSEGEISSRNNQSTNVGVRPVVNLGLTGYSKGDKFKFGYYPQTQVTSESLINSLNSQDIDWEVYEVYCGDGEDVDSSVKAEIMYYADVEYNGSTYRAIKNTEYRPALTYTKANDYYSYQDNNGYYTDNVYWFKYEPISWIVLKQNADSVFVISENALDSQSRTVYKQDFELKDWLNNEFALTAFTTEERSKIVTTKVSNCWCGEHSFTYEKLYFISEKDVSLEEYGFQKYNEKGELVPNYEMLCAKGTDYSRALGIYDDTWEANEFESWWIRGLGEPTGSGGGGGGGFGGGGGGFRGTGGNGTPFTIYPIGGGEEELFYLVIWGEVSWLKEMFDVEMVVINRSKTDTVENCVATLDIPEGLSLATMVGEQQTLAQNIGHVDSDSTETVHWYVRGDKEGNYNVKAKLEGTLMPFEEDFCYDYEAKDSVRVYAGSAMHMTFTIPDGAYEGHDAVVTIELENVSDKTLYNVSSKITDVFQFDSYYLQGDEGGLYYHTKGGEKVAWESGYAEKFEPGDKIILEVSTNILFHSRMYDKLAVEIGKIEKLKKMYDSLQALIDVSSGFVGLLDLASKNIDKVISEGAEIAGECYSALASEISKLYTKLDGMPESEVAQIAVTLINSDVWGVIEGISSGDWTPNMSDVETIIKTANKIKTIVEEKEDYDDPFGLIQDVISLLPVRYRLIDAYVETRDGSTTEIPYTIETYHVESPYKGVINMGEIMMDTVITGMGEIDTGYFKIFGISDPTGFKDSYNSLKTELGKLKALRVRAGVEDTRVKAWVVPANAKTRTASLNAEDFFTLSITENDTAEIVNGVLEFTGNATLNVTALSEVGGTLYIDMGDGDVFEYEIEVVEEHECSSEEWVTLLSASKYSDSYQARYCDICDELIDYRSVEACEEHSFGEWIAESEASCTVGGIVTRTCSSCGYEETSFIDATGHTEKTINKVDATCTADGYTGDVICEVCEETISVGEAVEANGHSYEAVITAPTCTVDGYTTNTCSVCQDSYISDATEKLGHTGGKANCEDKAICTACSEAYGEIKPDNHKNIVTDKAVSATCTSTGLTEGSHCDSCGKVVVAQTTTEKLSHTEEILPAVNATCSNTGLTEGKKCSVCDEILVKPTEIANLEHSYKSVVTVPTCTSGGYTTYTCSVCKDNYKSNETAKLGHNMGGFIVVEQPNCTENGVEIAECSRCDYSEVKELSATDHNYQDGVCTECGESKSDNCSCNCHKTGFIGFIWKILRFFYKLFGMNKVCSCGVAHY